MVSTSVYRQLFGPRKLKIDNTFKLNQKKSNLNLTAQDQNTKSQAGSWYDSHIGPTGYIAPLKDLPIQKLFSRSSAQTGTSELSASVVPLSDAQPSTGSLLANKSLYVIPESQTLGTYEQPPPSYRDALMSNIVVDPQNQCDLKFKQGHNTQDEENPGLPVMDPVQYQEELQPQNWDPAPPSARLKPVYRKILGSSAVNGKWKHISGGTSASNNQEALIQTSVHNYLWQNKKAMGLSV